MDERVATFRGLPPAFEPGARYDYSNSTFVLLGLITEAVTGRAWHVAVRERLLDPLGLGDTGFELGGRPDAQERLAAGYRTALLGVVATPPRTGLGNYAAGSIISTAPDLLAWTRAPPGGRVFRDPETLRLITTGRWSKT